MAGPAKFQGDKHAFSCWKMSDDCPGFLVLGAAPAPASTFVSEPEIILLG